ncbi:MAG: cation:proton antiporter [Eubacterium sp.]|nr:cation:proton antiporter [Eubacterium sp.]
MEKYGYLWQLALILASTKVFGLVTKRFHMPQVVGALLAGLIFGPAILGNLLSGVNIGSFQFVNFTLYQTSFINNLAEIGVIVLMFCAGLETDIKELKKCGLASFIIAISGVIVPLVGGGALTYWFLQAGWIKQADTSSVFMQALFVGVILTATSVSITVETLQEMGKLKTASGNAILGAAIIDDILGIVALTVIISLGGSPKEGVENPPLGMVLFKIVLFFVFVAVFGFVIYKLYKKWCEHDGKGKHRHAIMAFVICLIMAFAAESLFGVADITGAFFAGVIISMTQKDQFVASKFDVVAYMLLSPIFFASIGLKVDGEAVMHMGLLVVIYAVFLTIVAILTKVIGCGLGAKACGYKNYQCIRIGVGMVSRGEVALIVANKGIEAGLMSSEIVAPVIIVVIVTTILTPIILKPVFMRKGTNGADITMESKLVNNYEERAEYNKYKPKK